MTRARTRPEPQAQRSCFPLGRGFTTSHYAGRSFIMPTQAQRDMVQEALDRWWGPLMQMHGPRSDRARDRDIYWRIKAKTSEELRQEFLSIYVPRVWELGLTLPDPELRRDREDGVWHYSEPDWQELRTVVTNHGPRSQERLAFRRENWADTAWVRAIVLGARGAAA